VVTAAVTPTLDVAEAADRLALAPPSQTLAWAVGAVPRFAVSSSFGADSAVLLHLVTLVAPDLPVLFLDTGLHFPETLVYRRTLAQHLGLTDVRDLRPALTVSEQARAHGGGLSLRDPDVCCAIRKVAPLDAALAGYDGWASGVRRDQTLERSATPVVESVLRGGRPMVKVAPLARWTAADVTDYLDRHDLPRHPLAGRAAGVAYPSIGCAPCTRPIRPGEHLRAGRWSTSAKTECGIHLERR
jgi:phosphoadenosine phosphosulfate reductase